MSRLAEWVLSSLAAMVVVAGGAVSPTAGANESNRDWSPRLAVHGGQSVACTAVDAADERWRAAIDRGIARIGLDHQDAEFGASTPTEVEGSRRACNVVSPQGAALLVAIIGLEGVYSPSDSGAYLILATPDGEPIAWPLLQGRFGEHALILEPTAIRFRSASCIDLSFDGWRLRRNGMLPRHTVAIPGDTPIRYTLARCGQCGRPSGAECTVRVVPRRNRPDAAGQHER